MIDINRRPIVLIGKMGSGKSTVAGILENRYSTKTVRYSKLVTYTTRKMREGESPDAYHFITNAEFDKLEAEGIFAESYSTKKNGERVQYGSACEDYDQTAGWPESYFSAPVVKIAVLTPSGMRQVAKKVGSNAISVIYLRAKERVLRQRICARGTESEAAANERLEQEALEFSRVERECDLVIDTDNVSADEVANMVDRYVHRNLF